MYFLLLNLNLVVAFDNQKLVGHKVADMETFDIAFKYDILWDIVFK